MRDALGVPAGVLGASYIGFGALASTGAVSIWVLMASTVVMWALPGQLVMVEMAQLGAPLFAIVITVALTNARFLPMTITLLPTIRARTPSPWYYYLVAHCVAMTSWAICMRRCPDMPVAERIPYFVGLSCTCIVAASVAGATGYLIAALIPPLVQIGLVFLTPVYFFVILFGDVQSRLGGIALACGGVMGPLCYLVTPQWSVLVGGIAGGTLAFFIFRALEKKGV